MTTLLWILGVHIYGTSSQWYNFWSGFGSDLGELAIIGGLTQIYRRHTCHVHHCWRMGKHPVASTTYVTCRKHHPALTGPVTAEQIARESRVVPAKAVRR